MQISWSKRTGWYRGRHMTIEPNLMREVSRATAARKTFGDGAMSSGVR